MAADKHVSCMRSRGRQIDFCGLCHISTSGLAPMVYVEHIGYVQRRMLAAWAAERFGHDYWPYMVLLQFCRMEVSLDGLVLRSNIFSMQFIKVSVSVNVTVVSVTTGLFVLETFIKYFSKSVYTNGSDIDRFK